MTKRIGIPQLTKPTEAIKLTELVDLGELNGSNGLNWQIPTGGMGGGYGSLAAAQARNLLGSETSHGNSGMLPGPKGDKDEYTLHLGLCN